MLANYQGERSNTSVERGVYLVGWRYIIFIEQSGTPCFICE